MPETPGSLPKSKFKLAAIPLLVATLLWMLLGGTGDRDEGSSAQALSIGSSATQPAKQSLVRIRRKRTRNWPHFTVDDILDHNPFPSKHAHNAQTIADNKATPQAEVEVQLKPEVLAVKVYLTSAHGTVALVGDEVVSEGEMLEDGRVVTRLTSETATTGPAPPTTNKWQWILELLL